MSNERIFQEARDEVPSFRAREAKWRILINVSMRTGLLFNIIFPLL